MVTHGKRIAYGRNQNRVALGTYPDDTSVPVRTSHWNQDPHDQAVLGFTKITATLATDILQTKDDSSTTLEDDGNTYSRQSTLIEVVPQSGSSTDVISKINVIDTLENDILYLYKATESDTITIPSITPSAAGHIKTQLSGGATLVHDGVPIMLIRRGDYWYEFGADGAAVAITFTPTSTDVLTGKSIDLTDNTLTGTSAELATAISDETGSGALVFGTTPTITLDNATGLPPAGVTGTAAILGANTFTADQTVPATNKFIFGTNTYVYEPTTATPAIVAGNSTKMAWGALGTSIPATQRFYLDGSAPTGNTYFHESSADNIQFVAGGTAIVDIDSGGIDVNGTNIDNIQNLIHDTSATTQALDFNADQLQTDTIDANTTFTTSNRAIGRSKTIKLTTDGSTRTFTFPAWKFVGVKPTEQAASKIGILTLTCFGTADTDIVAAYAVEA